jgi:hypothetical protein
MPNADTNVLNGQQIELPRSWGVSVSDCSAV